MEMQLFKKEVRFTDVPSANLRWLNLEGRASNYNIKGSRNFELELPEDYARDLADLGWRVKKNGYDPDKDKFVNTDDLDADLDKAMFKIKVTVNYDSNEPPQVYRVVKGQNKRRLMKPDAENPDWNISRIDGDRIEYADLILNGWRSKKDGIISAFLAVGIFVVEENEVLDKWSKYELEDDGELPWNNTEEDN